MLEYNLMVEKSVGNPFNAITAVSINERIGAGGGTPDISLPTDPSKLEQETLRGRIGNAETYFLSTLRASSLLRVFPIKQWNSLDDARIGIVEPCNSLLLKLRGFETEKDKVVPIAAHAIRLASNVLIMDYLGQQEDLLMGLFISNPKSKESIRQLITAFRQYKDLEIFNRLGGMNIKIGNVTTQDAIEANNCSVADYYHATVLATVAGEDYAYTKFLDPNNEREQSLIKHYPNKVNRNIKSTCEAFKAMAGFGKDTIDLLNKIKAQNRTEKQIISSAKKITQQGIDRRSLIISSLFPKDMNSEDFKSFARTIDVYLKADNPDLTKIALIRACMDNRNTVLTAYRTSKNLGMQNTEHSSFYSNLANKIEQFVKGLPYDTFRLFTSNASATFLEENHQNETRSATFQELQKTIGQIRSKLPNPQYELDPETIDLCEFTTPKKITVDFSAKNYDEFTMSLDYPINEENDLSLKFIIDTNKGVINWDFLQDPNDPQLTKMKNAIMLLSKSVLSAIKKKAEKEHMEQISQKPTAIWTPREKFEKPEKTEIATPLKTELNQKDVDVEEEKNVGVNINFPEGKARRKLFKHFPPDNLKEIFEKIDRINATGAKPNDIKMLDKSVRHDRKPIIEIKVGNEYRVLTTSVETGDPTEAKQKLMVYKILRKERVGGRSNNKFYA